MQRKAQSVTRRDVLFDDTLSLQVVHFDASDALCLDEDLVVGGVGIEGDGKLHLIKVEESCMDEDLAFRVAAAVPSLDAQGGVAGRSHP